MEKVFTNKQLKFIILDLYKCNNIIIDDNLNKQLLLSSKTQYKTLYKLYSDIKQYIEKNISNSTTSNNENINQNDIIIDKKEIEIQTDIDIIINDKDISKELFIIKQEMNDYKFRYNNLKIEFKKYRKSNNINNNNYSSDDEKNIIIKEKRNINYHQLTELSSIQIINELHKLNRHQLKQLYNKYFSNKLNRKLQATNNINN